jgi:hypothetical protein
MLAHSEIWQEFERDYGAGAAAEYLHSAATRTLMAQGQHKVNAGGSGAVNAA